MAEITLKINGMSCQHCVMGVKKAVDSVSGVSSSDVEIGLAKVTYDENSASREAITAAIENAGYKIAE